MEAYVKLEQRIEEMEEKYRACPMILHDEVVKHALIMEARK
jgi:hypothetical protein